MLTRRQNSHRRTSDRYGRIYERKLLTEKLEPRWLLSSFANVDSGNSTAEPMEVVPDEILIGFEGDVAESFRAQGAGPALAAAGMIVQDLGLANGRLLMEVPANANGNARLSTHWKLPDGSDVFELARQLETLTGIAYAEPNYLLSIDATTPNDPRFSELWGMNNTGQTDGTADADIDAPIAWDFSTGTSNIVVGVIDTGVDYNHEDLRDNVWVNTAECPGGVGACVADGIDQDGNGYTDDFYGWDFVNDDNDPFDDNGHGSHTSGTIGAVGNNGIGVAGVTWDVQIMGLKFLNAGGGGSTADAIDAVNYATMMRNLYDDTGGAFALISF